MKNNYNYDPMALHRIPDAYAHEVKIKAMTKLVMVWLITLLLALIIGSFEAKSQSLNTCVLTEKTIMGQQLGGMLGYEMSSGLELGIFYQKNLDNYSEISTHGYEYTGLFLSKILFGYQDINLAPLIRAGFSDRNNLVVVPGIRMLAQLQKNLLLHVSTSIRASEATLGLGLTYRLTQL